MAPSIQIFPARAAAAVDRHAGFAIVEPAEDDVGPAVDSQAQVVDDVAVERLDPHVGIDLARPLGGDGGLRLPAVAGPKQDRARQVRVLDRVEVGDEDVADAQQRQILEDLVADRPRADQEHLAPREPLLVPPADQPESREAVVVRQFAELQGVGHVGKSPAGA